MDDLDTSLPLSSLSYEFRTLVSTLLNPKRIITSDGPVKLLRDWRGLACLLEVSSELAANISESPDKTGKLLDIWIQRNDGTATLKNLLEYLIKLDRYDVYDDILDLASRGRIVGFDQNNPNHKSELDDDESMIITHDDRRDGYKNYYHAYVLFAKEDWLFVREILARMRALGFKLCTEYDIDIGYGTQYAPVAQLISERCYRIILVYSPDFLDSPANSFYSDYAQAVGIESNKRNIIPIIYRECRLPPNLTYYHRLIYKPKDWAPYDFWEKLAQTLERVKLPTMNGVTKASNTTTVTELPSEDAASAFLNTTVSSASEDTAQLEISLIKDTSSTDSQTSSEKKKTKTVSKLLRFFKGKPKVYAAQ